MRSYYLLSNSTSQIKQPCSSPASREANTEDEQCQQVEKEETVKLGRDSRVKAKEEIGGKDGYNS